MISALDSTLSRLGSGVWVLYLAKILLTWHQQTVEGFMTNCQVVTCDAGGDF